VSIVTPVFRLTALVVFMSMLSSIVATAHGGKVAERQ